MTRNDHDGEVVALTGGFTDPPREAAHAFRGVMQAMARPGSLQEISGALPPAPLSVAAGTVLLTLCDLDTPVHLSGDCDTETVRAWIGFHTGAPITDASHCRFALGTWDALQPLSEYPIGTDEYPDRSATLIVEQQNMTTVGSTLAGPGIKGRVSLSLPATDAFARNRRLYPLGLDFLFTCEERVAAVPRSSHVQSPDSPMGDS